MIRRVRATVCLPTYNERENLERMVDARHGGTRGSPVNPLLYPSPMSDSV
jgi:hypothetical protein